LKIRKRKNILKHYLINPRFSIRKIQEFLGTPENIIKADKCLEEIRKISTDFDK
jgi:hypothetical protein